MAPVRFADVLAKSQASQARNQAAATLSTALADLQLVIKIFEAMESLLLKVNLSSACVLV
jgi:hypothetical protein